MDYSKIAHELVCWIQYKTKEAGAKGAIVGLSGGIDSAVVLALCKRAFQDNCLGLIMPCNSSNDDIADAKLVGDYLKVPYKVVDLTYTYNSLLGAVDVEDYLKVPKIAYANIKPRLRMTTLYYLGSLHNYLVVGTSNKSEFVIGYYTKYGDGGVDIEPIGNLVKSQVVDLARYLQLPDKIITKVPTAGLWENQTDEDEMGFSYQELDNYILYGTVKDSVKSKIERLNKVSEHKRRMPPIAPINR
jgi:NAD+ synthase